MLGASLKSAFRHPYPSLQSSWNYAQLGLLIFPCSPFLGAVGLVVALFKTWLRQYPIIVRRPLNWGFALLSVLLIITAGFANDKESAFLGLFNLLPFFLFFAAFNLVIQTPAQLRQLSWIVVIGSLPTVIMGFGQLLLGWTFKLKFLWIVLEWDLEPGGDPPGRMSSIFMHANILAGYLVIVFILGLGLWLENYRHFQRHRDKETRRQGNMGTWGHGDKRTLPVLPLLFLSVMVITTFVALILTNSRNAWAIAVAVSLAYALYQGWHILVASVSGITSGVLLAAFAPEPIAQLFRKVVPAFFWARLNDQLYPDRPVELLRTTQWQFAWSLAQQRPWTGWGIRNFTALYRAQMHVRLNHPHNLFLMLAAETGLPCTLLFCGLISWVFISGIQLLYKSNFFKGEDRLIYFSYLMLFVGWVLFNTADVTLFDFRLNTLSWLMLAAISGVAYRQENLEKSSKPIE
jgi:O-antigen ligase